jgi:hypothetical protein
MQISDGIRYFQFSSWGLLSQILNGTEQGLPVATVIHPVDAGIPEDLGCFPTMRAAGTTKDQRLVKVPDPRDACPDTIDGDVERPGYMPLVKFVGGPEIDDDSSIPQCLPDLSAASKNV